MTLVFVLISPAEGSGALPAANPSFPAPERDHTEDTGFW